MWSTFTKGNSDAADPDPPGRTADALHPGDTLITGDFWAHGARAARRRGGHPGIAQTDELAFSLSGSDGHYGTPPNPAALASLATAGTTSGIRVTSPWRARGASLTSASGRGRSVT